MSRRRYEYDQLLTRNKNNDNVDNTVSENESLPFAHVAFVGDAAHTLDPILAQGDITSLLPSLRPTKTIKRPLFYILW